jgi:hypothetical protein
LLLNSKPSAVEEAPWRRLFCFAARSTASLSNSYARLCDDDVVVHGNWGLV